MKFSLSVPNNQPQPPIPCYSVTPACSIVIPLVLDQSTHTLLPPLLSLDFNPPASMYQNSAWVLRKNYLVNFRLHHLSILSRSMLRSPLSLSTSYSHALLYHISTDILESYPFWASIFSSSTTFPYLLITSFNRSSPILLLILSTRTPRYTWPITWSGLVCRTTYKITCSILAGGVTDKSFHINPNCS